MNHLIASTYDASRGIELPSRRVEGGRKLSDLTRNGVQIIGAIDPQGYQHCKLPVGWRPIACEESPMKLLVQDEHGCPRLNIYYKPASQGGGASMEILDVLEREESAVGPKY